MSAAVPAEAAAAAAAQVAARAVVDSGCRGVGGCGAAAVFNMIIHN